MPAGVSTFAENPGRAFDEARIIWSAAVDPTVLTVSAFAPGDGALDLTVQPTLVAIDSGGMEHVAVRTADGVLRLDIVSGTVLDGPVALRVHLECTAQIPFRLSALDRLLRFMGIPDHGRRSTGVDARLARLVEALRVADALAEGASLSKIAAALRGVQRIDGHWAGDGDNIKSSVRRRVALARRLTDEGPAGILRHEI